MTRCVHYLSSNVFMLTYAHNGLSHIELASVFYFSRFRNVKLFLVREHNENWCSLVFAVHYGVLQGMNDPVFFTDFAIETALKMFP